MRPRYLVWLGLASLAPACRPARTLYLRNTTHQPLTLVLPATATAPFFPNGTRTLRFGATGATRKQTLAGGPGSWTAGDKDQLSALLRQSYLVVNRDTVPLTKGLRISHYGLVVDELFVRLRPPQ